MAPHHCNCVFLLHEISLSSLPLSIILWYVLRVSLILHAFIYIYKFGNCYMQRLAKGMIYCEHPYYVLQLSPLPQSPYCTSRKALIHRVCMHACVCIYVVIQIYAYVRVTFVLLLTATYKHRSLCA